VKGFSLIEIMIVLVITAILTGSATIYYQHTALRARRVEGRLALLSLSERMEAYHFKNHTYTGATPSTLGMPAQTEHQAYWLVVEGATNDEYQLRADPSVEDSACGSLMLSELGVKTVTGKGAFSECWL